MWRTASLWPKQHSELAWLLREQTASYWSAARFCSIFNLRGRTSHFKNPDGNTVELYIDTSDIWKQRPKAVAHEIPLDLSY
jgi:hypothetical protein